MAHDGRERGTDGSATGDARALDADVWPESLDPLAQWCAAVLHRAGDGAAPVTARPPLPAHLRRPLVHHGFDAFDEVALALTLAPDLDPVLGVAMSELSGVRGSRYPTLAVLADLVGVRGRERVALASRLSESGPLSDVGLLHIVPPADAPLVGRPARGPSLLDTCVASTALLRWVFGITQLDPGLLPLVRDDLGAPCEAPDPAASRVLADRMRAVAPTVTSLVGDRSADALGTALHAASRAGRAALVVDAQALVERPSARRVTAEALLREAAVIVVGDVAAVPAPHWEALATVVTVGVHPTLVAATVHDTTSLALQAGEGASVGAHLVDLLRARGLTVPAAEAARMTRWGHLRPEDLGRVADVLAARAAGRATAGAADDAAVGGRHEVTARDVAEVAAGAGGNELRRLATAVETSRDWSRLVLPEHLRDELRDLVSQAENRTRVIEESGFAATPGQPRGVTAVFAGPSGTGKTLAARLVAGELGLPLYAVNLAATVSKYIGETERNLDTVFAAAERTDAVLLFDEAEALFGKRSEVQDARDRYANIEVAFLLQRMERYDGVAILATNLLNHFDDAFARRLSFCLRFPHPDAAQRREIWRAVWPAGVRLAGDVDLDELAARHSLSGGHIRNVALAATHLAWARGADVDRASLQRAVEREYAKLGHVAEPLAAVPA